MVGASLARGAWCVSAALVVVCVSWSGVARAADVSVAVKRAVGVHDARLVNVGLLYRAGAGESSNLTVSFTGHRFTLIDSAADLRALTRCEQGDLHTVTCDEPSGTTRRTIDVTLGGGDDQFSFGRVDAGSQLNGRVIAGGGNDRIDASGASGDLSIDAGQGRNFVIGGPGNDRFYVGPGVNTLDGGPGENGVDFGKSVGPVHASVKDGAATAPGEADTFQRLQDLFGSRYDDVLIGDDGPNVIVGAEGDDTILGMGGNDHLDGFGAPARRGAKPSAYEHNLVFGGAGDDQLLATCKGADALVGGPGTNTYDLGLSGACVKRPNQGQLTRCFVV